MKVARLILSAFTALLVGTAVWAQAPTLKTESPFKWIHVNGDPCNPKAGCTLDWALEKSGWSKEVRDALKELVVKTAPETIAITSGLGTAKDPAWRGWMTWGAKTPKFKPDVIAAWSDGQYQPVSKWNFEKEGVVYNLGKVRACGNWAGWIQKAPVGVKPPAKKETLMPLGVLPVMACPETGESKWD